MKTVRPDIATETTIDPANPWLGLSSYSEETRAYFHGRDAEAGELARRVQRKLLTVLFGQSGLGKTSLLRAGLVPRLRGSGFCPVYVRIDYAAESPSPAEQIKQAIFKVTAEAGHWTRAGSAVEGESLWEFLHHRGDLLRDADGQTLLPLLIFDQFEEIFTLAQADDAGRQRAKRFLDELADLVENRPPADLERRLENDEAHADEFDFARADYRILISLREDYLAHLESVKGNMPSITQNRMRLARMNGEQALSAVMQPGGKLVSQEVAESIVRFVAGGSELPNAEVEPSLLSLICRELNTVRLAQGKAEISADLLAGSRDTILTEFYERALADQPADVRRVIEDELLTESGYRESLAEERVARALAAAGAAPDALAKLVDRRLLRIEERLDMRRVELTHDVLCGVVRSSRNLRHEREGRDEAERQLAAQQERAAETRRTLHRTRRFAMIAAGLMLVALVSAVFGWINWNRAKAADQQAQKARADAEKLVGFLIEDFYAELEPTGRLETMGKLAHMAVSYYDGLPPELLTPQTRVYRGMALIREAHALLAKGNFDDGNKKLDAAAAIFSGLRADGDHGEAVPYGLALARFTRFAALGLGGGPGSKPGDLDAAADLLRPLVQSGKASRAVQLTYADILNYLSHSQADKQQAIALCDESRKILEGLGAKDLTDLTAASIYADTADSESRHALALGRLDDAAQLSGEVYDIAEQVLLQRPGDLRSMANRALAASFLASLAARRYDYPAAEAFSERQLVATENQIRFNPSNLGSWEYHTRAQFQLASVQLEQGRVAQARDTLRASIELREDKRAPSSLLPLLARSIDNLARLEARTGNLDEARKAVELGARAAQEELRLSPADDFFHKTQPLFDAALRFEVEYLAGSHEAAYQKASAVLAALPSIAVPQDRFAEVGFNILKRRTLGIAAAAGLRTGHAAEAEVFARQRLQVPPAPQETADPLDDISRTQIVIAHSQALQGRLDEARETVKVALQVLLPKVQEGARGVSLYRDLAYGLYVDALTRQESDPQRAKNLAQAAQLLRDLPAEASWLSDIRELNAWVAAAR